MNFDYAVGSIIQYRAFGGVFRIVRVTEKEADVKNGEPGFCGVVIEGDESDQDIWGYDSQITRIVDLGDITS
jgi:hypothetical protein